MPIAAMREGGGATRPAAPSPNAVDADAAFIAGIASRAGQGGAAAVAQREKIRMVTLKASRGYHDDAVFRDAIRQTSRPTIKAEQTSTDDAKMKWYEWSDEERRAWAEFLVSTGAIDPEDATDMALIQKLWESAVDEASNYNAVGKKHITPWDAVRVAADFGGGPGSKQGGFTGRKTQRVQQIDLTDPATARAMVHDVLTRRLGREATDDEVRSFTQTLSAAEQANPTIVETIQDYQNGDLVNTSSTRSGGLDQAGKQRILDEQAMAAPEYGAYQAAAFYAPLLMQALSSPV